MMYLREFLTLRQCRLDIHMGQGIIEMSTIQLRSALAAILEDILFK